MVVLADDVSTSDSTASVYVKSVSAVTGSGVAVAPSTVTVNAVTGSG